MMLAAVRIIMIIVFQLLLTFDFSSDQVGESTAYMADLTTTIPCSET